MTPVGDNRTVAPASNNRSPLDEFRADIVDIRDEVRFNDRSKKNNTFILFDLVDLEIIKANEPYSFPTFRVELMEVNIPYSNWEVWKESVRRAGFSGGLNDLIGKRTHWKWDEAITSQPVPGSNPVQYSNRPGFCWQIVDIEGIEDTSKQLTDSIVALLDGKTETEFKQAFMADNSLRTLTGYSDVIVAVANNKFLPSLVTSGLVTVDSSGVYHRV